MEAAVFGQALREGFRFKRFAPWVVVSIVTMVFAMEWDVFQPNMSQTDKYGSVSSIFIFHILALVAAIVSSTIVAQEIEQKTIVYLLTRPVPRWKLLVFRYLACSIVVAVLSIIGALLTSLAVFGIGGSNPLLLKDMVALTIGGMAYCSFFMFINLLFNRGMILCLLFAFGWETAVPNMPGQMCYLSISSYLQAIAQHPSAGGNKAIGMLSASGGDNVISFGAAYMAMAIFIVFMVAIASWWFTNFEYLPREDAE